MTASVLMIGLDGADGAMLDRLSRDGTLPNLARLRARGVTARLKSPDGMTDDGFWASFQYASGLGEHGRYFWLDRRRTGRFRFAYKGEARRERFWDGLSAAGHRVAIIDIPKCAPPRPLNGVHLVDWLVHGRYLPEPRSFPPAYAADILRRFGPATSAACCDELGPSVSAERGAALEAILADSAARKLAAGLESLTSGHWDLFAIGFREIHCAGHAFTNLPRGGSGAHDGTGSDPVRALFIRLDAAIGQLVAAAGEAASVAVFTTLEMRANATLEHMEPEIVRRLNAQLSETWSARISRYASLRLSRHPIRRVCETLPYNEAATALRVNAPPRVRHQIVQRIAGIMSELVDVKDGRSVIEGIDKPSTELDGARAAHLPDLLVRYRQGVAPLAIHSSTLGRIEATPRAIRPGNHGSGTGCCILAGAAMAHEVRAVEDLGPLAARVLARISRVS